MSDIAILRSSYPLALSHSMSGLARRTCLIGSPGLGFND